MASDDNNLSVSPLTNRNGTVHTQTHNMQPQSPSPSMLEDWEDVTQTFHSARAEMPVGEIIHLDSFSLHAAMSAIELMDPKMDIGFGQDRTVSDVALPPDLSDQQVINIMDQLLICFMSWLDGHTLPQTVFSCVYAQLLAKIPRLELLSFLRVQLATLEAIINLVIDEKVADDEDFMASTYGFDLQPLFTDLPEQDGGILRKLLKEVDERRIPNSESGRALANAITLRVHFMVEFYRIVQCLSGYSFDHAIRDAPQLLRSLQSMAAGWIACPFRHTVDKQLITRVFDASINRHLMTSSPPRTASLFDSQSAFDYLKRILTELSALLDHEHYALPLNSESNPFERSEKERHSLLVAMHSIASFSAALNPTILTRSFLSRLMIPEYSSCLFTRDDADFRSLVASDMGFTDEMMSEDDLVQLETARQGVVNIFKCLCRNQSRQRRQLLRVIRWWDHYAFTAGADSKSKEIASGDKQSAETVTQSPTNETSADVVKDISEENPSSSSSNAVEALFDGKSALQVVSYEIAAWLMTRHWLLGFEIELYQEYEYSAVFFYVGYVLTTMSNATMSLARKGQSGATLHSLRFALHTMDEARLWMCRALYSALEGLSQGTIWKYSCGRPEYNAEEKLGMFGTEALWYEQRFGVAMGMVNGPAYADYSSYLSFKAVQRESLISANPNETDVPLLLLQDAANGFLTARRTLEAAKDSAQVFSPNNVSEEILQIARAAVENSLALTQCMRIYRQATADQQTDIMYEVNFKFRTHRHFPVIKVTPL